MSKTKAKKFDEEFDTSKSIMKYLDLSKPRRRVPEQRRVNVAFPVWMIEALDREASQLGVSRQALIKVLIARHLEQTGAPRSA